MAPRKADALAAKQAKQKKMLIVGGVLLLALAAIQGPKLMKQVRGTSAKPATTTASGDATTDPAAATPSAPSPGAAVALGAVPVPTGPRPTASLVGVPVYGAGRPTAGDGQLQGFSLFRAKDPFVQQIDEDEVAKAAEPAPEPAPEDKPAETAPKPEETPQPADAKPGTEAAGAAKPGDEAAAGPAAEVAPEPVPEPDPLYATLVVNGLQTPLEVDGTFPESDPLFVLVSLKTKVAEISIVGGTLTKGKTLKLTLGKPVTLVNTATGARYRIKLVYTGSTPEEIKSFTEDETLPSAIPDAQAVPDAVTGEGSTPEP